MNAPAPAPPPTTLVARGPTDLLALVPIVLGFHPRESVVLMTFGATGTSFHARVDLPVGPSEREEAIALLADAARTNDVRTAAVLLMTDDAAAAREVGVGLAEALVGDGVEVIDVVRGDGRHWWPVRRERPEGPGTPYDVRSHRFTAERVLEGRAAFRDRDELAASIEPGVGPAADADRDEITRRAAAFAEALLAEHPSAKAVAYGESARWLRSYLRRRASRGPDAPTRAVPAAVAARICLLAGEPAMRDVVCTMLTRQGAAAQVPLWRELTRRAPDHLVEGVASVLALTAWLAGDGALAWCAIDRCHRTAGDDPLPGRGLADLVAGLLDGAVCPDRWEPVEEELVPLLAV